jgi:hypothetical protein
VKSRRHDWTKRLRYVCACSKILEHFSWEFSRNASDQVRHGGALAGRCQSQKQANTPQLILPIICAACWPLAFQNMIPLL